MRELVTADSFIGSVFFPPRGTRQARYGPGWGHPGSQSFNEAGSRELVLVAKRKLNVEE